MRKLTLKLTMIIAVLMMAGCGAEKADVKDFEQFANKFYVQMFTDGEQSEKATEMYEEMVDEYEAFEDEELYENLAGMYKGLGGEGDAEQYRQQVTKILNEGVE